MNRKHSVDTTVRKKNPYKPIMLTSKSMKPAERRSPEKIRVQPKSQQQHSQELYHRKPTLNCMLYANSATRNEIVRKLTEQYRETLLNKLKRDCTESEERSLKPIGASIVQMEFDSQEGATRTHSRYDDLLSSLSFEQTRGDSMKKYFYYTSMKNYENFGKAKMNSSNGFSKKNRKIAINPHGDQMKPFLDKNYLNIKKMNPKNKSKIREINVSPQKMKEIAQKVQDYQSALIKKMEEKYRVTSSTVCNRSPSKQEPEPKQIVLKTEQHKIQEDMTSKKSSSRKDYFTFGMSDNKFTLEVNNRNKFEAYKDFLWKINFSNGLYVKIKEEIDFPYKLYVGPGNNCLLIKGIMRRRFWWQIVDKPTDDTNFLWSQLKSSDFFKIQKAEKKTEAPRMSILMRNRKVKSSMEKTPLNKEVEFLDGDHQKNISKDCIAIELEKKQTEPLKKKDEENLSQNLQLHGKVFSSRDIQLWKNHIRKYKKIEQKLENTVMHKRIKTLVRKKKLKFIQESRTLKIQNHFQCNYYLGNKKALFYSMRKYYTLLGKNPFQHIPLTYHICGGLEDVQFEKFMEKYEEFQLRRKNKEMQNIWIVKPGEFTNRGKGITVCSVLDDIKVRIKSKPKPHTFIVQKYIERPLLYYKRKFDIRHFMLMSCVNGKFKGYWYSEGYLRTTSSQYSTRNCKDLYTHLTNDAIQKFSSDYGKFQKGNKVSYSDFQKYLNSNYRNHQSQNSDRYDFFGNVLPQMKNLATDAMKATYMYLSPKRYEHNFELFGLDFMLDEDMNVYLIQVNTNPCLEISCPFLSRLLSGLIENVFKICVDPLFPPPFEWANNKKMQMGQNALDENRFTLVFDESEAQYEIPKLYENNSLLDEDIGNIEEEDQEFDDQGKEWVED